MPGEDGVAYLFLSRSVSTELRRWRLTCVTRAWMSLPGKEPAPSLPESHTEMDVPQRREGWGMSGRMGLPHSIHYFQAWNPKEVLHSQLNILSKAS